MTKAEYLEICSQHWEDLQNLHRHDNLYDFEKDFAQMAQELARKSLEGILGNVPKDYRKKTFTTTYGKVAIDNRSLLSRGLKGCKISPLLRERVLYLGQEVCLENASELIKEVMGVEVSDTTIHREIETYGKEAESWIEQSSENAETREIGDHEVMYCEADGSMILTREESWKEVKLGRIFRSDFILDKRSEGNKIKESKYIARLGHFTDFLQGDG